MTQDAGELLQQIIRDYLGNNSLHVFLEFHQGESLEQQYNSVFQVFSSIFGEQKSKEILKPISDILEKEITQP